MERSFTSFFRSTLPFAIFGCLIPLTAEAQISADGTTSTTVNKNGNDFTIDQGDRIDDNLFHSFNEFSVPTLGSAAFNNAGDIANIFSRVTGSNISSIDGLISANGAANLFLINPNGIIFGENASLNLGGSFFASTADSLLFEGDTEFSAVNPQAPPLLEVSIPIGLNFRDNPGEIVNRSFVQNNVGDFVGLEVAPGNNLTLLGGDINFEAGEATARGGNIELGGLSEAGTVTFNEDDSLNFPEDVALADIFLNGFADVDVTGTGGGSIIINARNLNLESGDSGISLIRAGITADSNSSEAQAGDITINATENVTVDDSSISNKVNSRAVGNAGDIIMTTSSLSLTNGGKVDASTLSQGNAGSIKITASDTITFDGEDLDGLPSGAFSQVASGAVGDAEGVTITAASLFLTNGGLVDASTFGQGNAGAIEITASDTITFDGENLFFGIPSGATSQVGTEAEGDAGGMSITTGSLILTNGGRIDASTGGQGNASAIEITARDTITFDGESSFGSLSGAISVVIPGAEGDAEGVTITAGSMSLTNGGRIDASTGGQGNAGAIEITASDTIKIDGESFVDRIASGANSQVALGAVGNAGGVTITTGSLSLTNGGQVSASTFGQGNADLVEITASDTITFDGEDLDGLPSGATSQVGSRAVGNAEGVTITAGSLFLTNGGRIDASTVGQGNAGLVEITASDTITFDGEQSDGTPSGATSVVVPGAVGDAGGVTITTSFLSLTNGGRVSVSTEGQGNAGLVEITARDTITFDGADLGGSHSGAFSQVISGAVGDARGVTINTGSLFLTNGGLVSANTEGQGNSGLVEITATDSIKIDGEYLDGFPSGVTSQVGSRAVGDAEAITISTSSLTLTNGGQVSASTFGEGDAGDVTVNVRESIFISGVTEDNRSGLSADAFISRGNGGDVNVVTEQLTIDDGGSIEAGNFDSLDIFAPGTGQPGNINIEANSLSLSNRASIEAATQSEIGAAANINLIIAEDIILRNNSLISATALENADGGNVTINASDGLIIAFPNQNNDIIANADRGNGGNIDITTQAIFGMEERRSVPQNTTNDIDASSEFGLQGNTSLNTPEVDPTSGLIELPEAVGDASDQISQNPCEQGVGSEFIITGKGGLAPNPHETLNSDKIRVGLVDPVPSRQEDGREEINLGENSETLSLGGFPDLRKVSNPKDIRPENSTPEAVPAMGWIFNEKGEVTLTAYQTTDLTTQRDLDRSTPNNCSTLKQK